MVTERVMQQGRLVPASASILTGPPVYLAFRLHEMRIYQLQQHRYLAVMTCYLRCPMSYQPAMPTLLGAGGRLLAVTLALRLYDAGWPR